MLCAAVTLFAFCYSVTTVGVIRASEINQKRACAKIRKKSDEIWLFCAISVAKSNLCKGLRLWYSMQSFVDRIKISSWRIFTKHSKGITSNYATLGRWIVLKKKWAGELLDRRQDGKRSFLSTSAAGEISYLNPCCPSAYRRGLSISKFLLGRLTETTGGEKKSDDDDGEKIRARSIIRWRIE